MDSRKPAGYVYEEGSCQSRDGHCRAFSKDASGVVTSDGAAVVVLKRMQDALADGDTIQAVIRGSALNNDGAAKPGYTAPTTDGQARCIREAIAVAGLKPENISLVEAHGTATSLGDRTEVAALLQAFGNHPAARLPFCALGSAKSNIGHADLASGGALD